MKTILRQSVFETNSSSNHSLVIYKEVIRPQVNIDKLKFEVNIEDYCFSNMSDDDADTPKSILAYIWTAILTHQDWGNSWATDAEQKLKEWTPLVVYSKPENIDDYYINHQSNECEFIKMIMLDKELFERTLTSGTILCSADCCSTPYDLATSGGVYAVYKNDGGEYL